MSVLSEYESIRNEIGEKAYADLEIYLSFHPHLTLSNLYYNQSHWNKCREWLQKTPEYFKKSEPIYCVEKFVDKDFSESALLRFLGTRQEIAQRLRLPEKEIDEMLELATSINKSFVTGESNVTDAIGDKMYTLFVSNSPESLIRFINCENYCVDEEDYSENLGREFDEYCCGKKGLTIAKQIIANEKDRTKPSLNDQIWSAEKKAGNQTIESKIKEAER